MESWSTIQNNLIDKHLENVKEKDLRFYRIDEFKRNISRIDSFAKTCPICKKEQQNISEAVRTIDEAINVPGQKRKEYDKLISRLSKHIQKAHKFYAPYYFTYLYSFFGIIAGIFVGFILLKIFPEYKWAMFSLGLSLGMICGYYFGFFKDKIIRSEKKIM